ncbi:hypothetical protein H7I87_00290 [Mycobacterium timonense]|uniref:Uncharacterized protein n=2 Tax=Mycobacterium avium complex (MAC) TaxID=120793 RepID=A0AAW5S1C6_MYCBC|nr:MULTISPECIES: hypothetical protein [Mycobacterium avium complex (MAC)]MCV6988657.1 hypothetical protein [Mycobacterium bouchedurhonense]MCV6993205.1 hypothetical protein [Mycobacterium timonense]MDV3306433.1 hypothetical protein [Mycobacterium avium subsp. hominissuis]ORA45545.1 hypothetical protein BST19_20235 [Mycobacterium bouchedurhonense]ORB76863.1 hypothetical protein BST46_27720 [Mycobacterium timonense]
MAYTTIPVCYRDYADYRWHGDIRLEGAITPQQVGALRAALVDGALYAPLQVGLTHCGAEESRMFPGVNDHGWHEMDLDGITIDEWRPSRLGCVSGPDEAGTVAEFVARMQRAAAAGWQPLLPGLLSGT